MSDYFQQISSLWSVNLCVDASQLWQLSVEGGLERAALLSTVCCVSYLTCSCNSIWQAADGVSETWWPWWLLEKKAFNWDWFTVSDSWGCYQHGRKQTWCWRSLLSSPQGSGRKPLGQAWAFEISKTPLPAVSHFLLQGYTSQKCHSLWGPFSFILPHSLPDLQRSDHNAMMHSVQLQKSP